VPDLSIAYGKLIEALGSADVDEIGEALLSASGARYESTVGDCELLFFTQGSARFLFDLASSRDLPQADRTVAAYAATPASVATRDASYQRGFPMEPASETEPVDRGHLIPRLSGGEYGPNIFRQDRALNRGWSEEGKQFRELERRAAARVGSLYFGHLIYTDDSDYPAELETGWAHQGVAEFRRFDNRPFIVRVA
jgi:hypothetical protein